MQQPSDIRKIAFLGDYLPRKCGIATFTTDLRCAVAAEFPAMQCLVVPVNDIAGGYDYPAEVRFEIAEQDLPSYLRASDFLNITDVDVVCVEHEFGIFGGPAGSHVLALLRELQMPIVTTLHTVLREPSPEQRRVMRDLIRLSTRLVTMTERGQQFLREVYQAPEAADVRFTVAEQGHRVCFARAAGHHPGISKHRLHRAGPDASESAARRRRSLPPEPGTAGQRPRRAEARRVL
jgi:hypothetical protein